MGNMEQYRRTRIQYILHLTVSVFGRQKQMIQGNPIPGIENFILPEPNEMDGKML
jgi:hypothetical protein